MDFGPAHTRLTRTSSDLRTLSAILLPQSPILTADDLLIPSTSGEIPILLEATMHVCDSPLSIFTRPPGFPNIAEEQKLSDKLVTTMGNTSDLNCSDEAFKLDDWKYEESNLYAGRCTELPSDSHPAEAFPRKRRDAIQPAVDDFLGSDAERSSERGDCATSVFIKQDRFETLEDPQASCSGTVEVGTTVTASKEDHDGDHPLMMATFHTYSTMSTPTFAPPSPSPSADVISFTSPVARQRHRRPLERARAVRFPGRPRSPRLHVNDVESNFLLNASSSPTKHPSHPRWQLADPVPSVPTSSCRVDARVSDAHPSMKHVVLPEELSWIKHMVIELWIDQEGFRAVRPCMQLVGYSPRTRSLHPYESVENTDFGVTAGVAEFMPMKRETFTFHYATLDSPPTLRMVSVAGDESRDYISRQATLNVKANGVYTVLGSETFIATILNDDAHGLKLRWKFDYLVSDRKVDGTGKILPGEKTLTPLTFSCSPYLFHPLQGKKAGLMHIMKKNLVLRLGSQKLEPPTHRPSHNILPQTPHHLSTGRDAAAHNRSHSDASAKSRRYLPVKSPLDPGGRGENLGMSYMPRTRRRRASSAGEDSLAFSGKRN